jgi:hypothetical protein
VRHGPPDAQPTEEAVLMLRFPTWLPRGARLGLLDVVLIVWVAAWIWVGISISDDVRAMTGLTETVTLVGEGIRDVGNALSVVSEVPLVGDQLAKPAEQVEEIGASAVRNGQDAQESSDQLATLLGLAIALIPSLPVLFFYLPARVAYVLEARALRRTVEHLRDDPDLAELLARRALLHASYRQLAKIGDPLGELRAGRYDNLVAAELQRLGLQAAWVASSSPSDNPTSPR